MRKEEIDLEGVPQAHSVQVIFCEDPKCMRPHVLLRDDEGRPVAHFVVPKPRADGSGFMKDLHDALYRSAVEKDE